MTECDAHEARRTHARFRRDDIGAFLRYAAIGLAQNAVFYSLALILISVGFAAWHATAILFPVAVALSFLANRAWSFADRKRAPAEFRKYILVYAIAYPAAVAMTWAQERVGVPSWLASLITLIVAAIGIFLVLNRWVFRKTPTGEINPTTHF